jgi:hypothetical protein
MANQDAAFGLRPLKSVGQQDDSTGMTQYNILPGDASTIFQGDLVIGVATGYIDITTVGNVSNLGAFWGCFYDDPTTQKPTFRNAYPGGITPANGGAIDAFVYDSPHQMFEVQSNAAAGTMSQADIFSTAAVATPAAGTTINGVSGMELDQGTIAQAVQQLKIIGLSRDPENSDFATANVNFRVMINAHLLGSGRVGI